jgi:hypothetical protein
MFLFFGGYIYPYGTFFLHIAVDRKFIRLTQLSILFYLCGLLMIYDVIITNCI